VKAPSQPLGKTVVTAEINLCFCRLDLSRNKLIGSTALLAGAEINLSDPPIC
jgi:hypothetical protein